LQKPHLTVQSLRFKYHTKSVWIAALQHIVAEEPALAGKQETAGAAFRDGGVHRRRDPRPGPARKRTFRLRQYQGTAHPAID